MRNVHLPQPSPFETNWRRGSIYRQILMDEATRAQGIYRHIVAVRTGALRASAKPRIIPDSSGALEGWLIVGGEEVPYEAAHELRDAVSKGGAMPKDLLMTLKILDATR